MLALRDALALRQTLAAGQTLTPEQAASLRVAAAAAARTGPARTPGASTAKRTAARKPASRAKPRTTARSKAARPSTTPRTGARWSTRLRVIALSTVLLPAVASLALPGAPDGAPGGGPLDATSLALAAQSSLLASTGEYRRLEQETAARTTELQHAQEAQEGALAQVAADQQVVGQTAAGMYRAAADMRYPLLGVTVHDGAATSTALYRQALVERSAREVEGAVVRAERAASSLEAAASRVAQARSAIDALP